MTCLAKISILYIVLDERLVETVKVKKAGVNHAALLVFGMKNSSANERRMTMSLSRQKQSDDVLSLRDAMNRLFDASFFWPASVAASRARAETIPLDVYEENDNLVVKAAMPEMKPEDVNIEVRDNVLTVSGETKEEQERKDKDYLLRERSYGHVERSVALPYDVQVDKANAEFENGMLTITLPKAEPAKTNKISLKPKAKA